MLDEVRGVLAGEDAWVVGGAIREELLGKPVLDLDVVCRDPKAAAQAYGRLEGGAVFRLSGPHGAWRVARRDGRTVDFTPLAGGIEQDLAGRDFTINAIARRLAGGEEVDPYSGRSDLEQRVVRALGPDVFRNDPLRLLRAVRFEDQLGFRIEPETEGAIRRDAELASRPAGERTLGELAQMSAPAYRRLDELGVLAPLGGALDHLARVEGGSTQLLLVAVFGEALERLPISNQLRRYARTLLKAELPIDLSPRAIHRFRRATEPWAIDAARLHGGSDEVLAAVEAAREGDPAGPLLRGDELGLPPGPEIGRLLALIAEERAAGTISTRDEALELVRKAAAP
jgi:tRNA nucleotidyltransferase/poly(A) polymerase